MFKKTTGLGVWRANKGPGTDKAREEVGDMKGTELRRAVRDLQERGLTKAAKWAAEQLVGLPASSGITDDERLGGQAEARTTDQYLLAKTYFDLREYKRAASVLAGESDPKSTFLRCYSNYLSGERRKEEQALEEGELCVNEELEGIERELRAMVDAKSADPFLLYLYGLVLIDREKNKEAKKVLEESVRGYPCNWGAWQGLQEIQEVGKPLDYSGLPDHWMSHFFVAANCLENGDENEKGLEEYRKLQSEFPNSEYILAQAATAHYNLRQFDEAQHLFETLHRKSPHRIESMDTYSNILYVKEAYAGLSHLAHSAILTDKYKPETCCIIGNYYSLRTQHEKAVSYFRRALKLNRNYLSAWTLMGHEYVEMKNPEAAIEVSGLANTTPRPPMEPLTGPTHSPPILLPFSSYSPLILLSGIQKGGRHKSSGLQSVVRTWSDLRGPAHALLRALLLQASHQAQAWRRQVLVRHGSVLRERGAQHARRGAPGEIRFLRDKLRAECSNNCPTHFSRRMMQCYKNAELKGDREGIALAKIADLYRKRGDYEAAYLSSKKTLEKLDGGGEGNVGNIDVVATLLFLTQHCKGTGRLDESEKYCARLLDYGGNHREDAKSLLKEIRLLKIGSAGARETDPENASDDNSDDGEMDLSD